MVLNKLRETMRQTQQRYVHASDTPQLFYFSAGTCQKIHAQIAFAFVALAFLNHY
jgi:hypothetical protein